MEGHSCNNKKFHPEVQQKQKQQRAKPKCSICKQEGHTKRSCKPIAPPIETDVKTSPPVKVEMSVPINIDNYINKFETYPSDLLEFAVAHNLALPRIGSLKGQALALLSQPEVRGKQHVRPSDTTAFFQAIQMETRDSIQPFNKGFGLKEINVKQQYCLVFPFELDTLNIDKRKGVVISGDRDASINATKNWWKENLVDVPNDQWQIGHLDPTINDASEKNLAYQPPIQGRYRDRFKFDPLFHKMWPTGAELVPKMNDFYTENERRAIYEALKQEFAV